MVHSGVLSLDSVTEFVFEWEAGAGHGNKTPTGKRVLSREAARDWAVLSAQ